MDKRVVVLGAANIDVKGRIAVKSFSRTKSPGKIELSAGGVGRNIAENISRLGLPVTLLSAVGNEGFSDIIVKATKSAGVDVSRILKAESTSGVYMAIINSRGEIDSSVSDMSILSKITPEYLLDNADILDQAGFLVIDADIPEPTLALSLSMAKDRGIPVCIEPVSPAKAQFLSPYLSGVTMTTPNRDELESMLNRTIVSEDDIRNAAYELIDRGVEYVIVTLGAEGVFCASKGYDGFVPSIRTIVVNSVGAGDALVGGTVAGFMQGKEFVDCIKQGIACATVTIMDEKAVSPMLNRGRVKEFIQKIN